ncbi:MAG: hypothetical protein JXR59_11090 [Desulfuromonadaceae bacterium]|nr:hypothetical protein [Desulfuromonadaceae bacterium]
MTASEIKHTDMTATPSTKPQMNTVAQQLDALRTLTPRQKYKQLLNATHPEQLVQAMPPQDLFLLIKELGAADVPELVGLASADQLTCFIDMDGWRDEQLDTDQARQWLGLILEQEESDQLRLIDEMDFDLLVLVLKKQLEIVRGLEALDDDELEQPRLRRDQLYECLYQDEQQAKALETLQELLFRERREFYLMLMEAVRHELELALEEHVFQHRNGRLADLGFDNSVQARQLRSWLDPATFNAQDFRKQARFFTAPQTSAPGFVLTVARPRDLLADVIGNSLTPELCQELSFLLNRAMSADGVDFGDPQQVQQSLEDVYHLLNIALGFLAGQDIDQATQLFEQVYLQALYRLGFSLLLRLSRRARQIRQSAIGPYLDGPDAALIDALDRDMPRCYAGVAEPLRGGDRPFQCRADVDAVDRELACIEALRQLFEGGGLFSLPQPDDLDLRGCQPALASEVTLSELFLTAVANQVMGRPFAPAPLALNELPELHRRLTDSPGAFAAWQEQSRQLCEQQAPGSAAFVDFCFNILQQEFCALEPADLKPEFVGGFLLRLA